MWQWLNHWTNYIQDFSYIVMLITVLVHLFFAGAVAKDGAKLQAQQIPLALVSPLTWAFATLIGGIYAAAIYWLLHHSTLTRR